MNTAKHTPGPWSIDAVRNETEKLSIVDADMCFVADVWQTYVNGKSRQQDNAHLIAAAPAMYEGLKYLIHLVGEENVPGDILATIAQAEGRHS